MESDKKIEENSLQNLSNKKDVNLKQKSVDVLSVQYEYDSLPIAFNYWKEGKCGCW